ncbi:hypothetical protein D3C81_1572850 [compost metagenome]
MQEHAARLRHAVCIDAAQQGDAVGAGCGGTRLFHLHLHDGALDAFVILGLRRGVRFRHQNVAIWQYVQPARMVEVARIRMDGQAGRDHGALRRRPALHGRHVDGGNQLLVRRGQHWLRAEADGHGRRLGMGGSGAAGSGQQE